MIYREEKEGLKILNEGNITVGLETTLTEDLIKEGDAREIVNKIQNTRKELNFNVVDRIKTYIYAEDRLIDSIKQFEDYIKNETLTEYFEVKNIKEFDNNKKKEFIEWDINGKKALIKVER